MRIHGCEKSFGGRTAVRVPELLLEPGQIYAAVGANGSGKSTFARLVSGALSPDGGGRALEDGVRVGYMPQRSYAFRMTVQANLLLAGGDRARAERLMAALRLDSLAVRRAGCLSGGETAKMALARVLMTPCDLLVLDEPTAPMDMESVMLAERLVAAYREETNCAVVMITHDLQQARRTADQALFFYSGELREAGVVEKVLRDPDCPETRRFLEFYGGLPAGGLNDGEK